MNISKTKKQTRRGQSFPAVRAMGEKGCNGLEKLLESCPYQRISGVAAPQLLQSENYR